MKVQQRVRVAMSVSVPGIAALKRIELYMRQNPDLTIASLFALATTIAVPVSPEQLVGSINAPLLATPWAKPDIYLLSGSPMSQIGSGPDIVTLNYPMLRERIALLRAGAPEAIIIVYAHDGLEFRDAPTPRQRQWARLFALAGADIVLFSHNHRYGPFQILEDTPRRTFVAWSLGNFIFGGNLQWRRHRDVRLLSLLVDPASGRKEGRWLYGATHDWEFSFDDEHILPQPRLDALPIPGRVPVPAQGFN